MSAYIFSISVKPETPGERGLPKKSVGSAQVTHHGVDGDYNKHRHQQSEDNPADRALLILPLETLARLNNEGWPVKPGDIGENITTVGIFYDKFASGKCYRLGEIEIRIYDEAHPCGNLKRLPYITNENYPDFKKRLEGSRGWYARVLKEGTIKINDSIEEIL